MLVVCDRGDQRKTARKTQDWKIIEIKNFNSISNTFKVIFPN